MPTLEELKEQLTTKEKERVQILNKIDKAERTELEPELKKRFEGKFFKYRNSYGSGGKWWLYAHCTAVKHPFIISNTFQICTYGNADFKVGDKSSMRHFQNDGYKQITKAEYKKAFTKFHQHLKKMEIK